MVTHGADHPSQTAIKLIDREHWALRYRSGYPDSASAVKVVDHVDIPTADAVDALRRYFTDVEPVDIHALRSSVYVVVGEMPHGHVLRTFVRGIKSVLRGTTPHV